MQLDCEDSGELKEHIGCKIERKGGTFKLAQPALVQSLQDEFDIPDTTPCSLPAPQGKDLKYEGDPLTEEEKKLHRSGVGKLLVIMRCSRPDTLNVVR